MSRHFFKVLVVFGAAVLLMHMLMWIGGAIVPANSWWLQLCHDASGIGLAYMMFRHLNQSVKP